MALIQEELLPQILELVVQAEVELILILVVVLVQEQQEILPLYLHLKVILVEHLVLDHIQAERQLQVLEVVEQWLLELVPVLLLQQVDLVELELEYHQLSVLMESRLVDKDIIVVVAVEHHKILRLEIEV